jgi:hypothetical protein
MTLMARIGARPPVQRRILAIGLLVATVGLVWGGVLAPLTWVVDSQDEWRDDVRHDLARAMGEASTEPELRRQVAAIPAEPIWAKFYETQNGQDASQLVQRDVLRAGAGSGVKIEGIVPLPKVEEVGLVGFGIRFTTTLSAGQLKQFIDALRANVGYLRVERLTITAPQVQRADENALLTVTMEVYGFSRFHPSASS